MSNREIDVTIPASFLAAPRRFALDVVNSANVVSNSTDFTVLESIAIPACSGNNAAPGAVAIDEQRNWRSSRIPVARTFPSSVSSRTPPTGLSLTVYPQERDLPVSRSFRVSDFAVVTNSRPGPPRS